MSNSLTLRALFLAALLFGFPHTASLESQPRMLTGSLEQSPNDVATAVQTAGVFSKAGRYPEAIGLYQRVLRYDPRNQAAEIGLAEAFRGVHNYDMARVVLRAARRQHPKNTAILAALGTLEIEAESWDVAIEALRGAVAQSPSDMSIRNLLGAAYLGKEDKLMALAQFTTVLARDPGNQLARFHRAQIYADGNENEKALADSEAVYQARPNYLPGRTLLAKILVRLKQCERAAEVLRPVDNPPEIDTESLFLLGNAYECAGKAELAESARDEFAAASQRDRRRSENEVQSKHLYEQANELARQNHFGEALGLLQQALEKNPKNGFAYSQRAKIYFSMQQVDRAREAIGQALALQPFQPDFLYVQGFIDEKTGDLDAALATFEKVVEINPREADAYFEIGRIWLQRKDRARALGALRKAASLAPEDPDYRRALDSARASSP